MDKTLLTIDCGTQSLRAMIFSGKGELLAMQRVFFESWESVKPGWAENDAELYWNALVTCCQNLKNESPGMFSQITAINITTIKNTMINVDKNGKPLRSVIL